MSGETVREVIVKMSIEMASKIAAPDLRSIETVAKDAGEKAGKNFKEAFDKVSSGVTSHSDRMRMMLDDYDSVNDAVVRLTRSTEENAKATTISGASVKSHITNTLELARGIGLLGAALGDDTTKWLKFTAGLQGALDSFNSIHRTVSSVIPVLSKFGSMLGGGGSLLGGALGGIGRMIEGPAGGAVGQAAGGFASDVAANVLGEGGGAALQYGAGRAASRFTAGRGAAAGARFSRGIMAGSQLIGGQFVGGQMVGGGMGATGFGGAAGVAAGGMALGAAALAASPFVYEHYDQKMREADEKRNAPKGMDVTNRAFLQEQQRQLAGGFQAGQASNISFQSQGIAGWMGSKISGGASWLSRSVTGYGQAERDITERALQQKFAGAERAAEAVSGAKKFIDAAGDERAGARLQLSARGLDSRNLLDEMEKGSKKYQEDLGAKRAKSTGPAESAMYGAAMKSEQLESDKARLPVIKDIISQLEHEKAIMQQNVALAKEQWRTDEARLKNRKAQIGMMSDKDFAIAEQLAAKEKRGEKFTQAEEAEAERLGGGSAAERQARQEALGEQRPELGREWLSRDARQREEGSRRAHETIEGAAAQAMPEIDQEIADLKKKSDEIVEGLAALFKAENEAKELMLKEIKGATELLAKFKAELEAEGVAAKPPAVGG